MKVTREKVYEAIDSERDYQNSIRKDNEKETRNDNEKCLSDFLIYIEYVIGKAKNDIYYLNENLALHNVRKIAGLCVAAMESFGAPKREL